MAPSALIDGYGRAALSSRANVAVGTVSFASGIIAR
jgi:hypothetical protein